MSGTATTTEMEASDNPAFTDLGTDPTLVTTSYKKNRFYLFTNRSSKDLSSIDNERDVFNEKPSKEDIISATEEKGAPRLYKMPQFTQPWGIFTWTSFLESVLKLLRTSVFMLEMVTTMAISSTE